MGITSPDCAAGASDSPALSRVAAPRWAPWLKRFLRCNGAAKPPL